MKNMFKLAAIAVSMALVAGLAACSSGDDDVVDASTPEYLVTAQIDKYVASIKYEQNVSDDEIKSLKAAHEAMMKVIGDCEDCLAYYFNRQLKYQCNKFKPWYSDDENKVLLGYYLSEERKTLSSTDIKNSIKALDDLKSKHSTEKFYHKTFVYIPAIENALSAVYNARSKVIKIGDPTSYTDYKDVSIVDGKLNDRQADNMKAYTDAAAALTVALTEEDSKKGERATIKAANTVIEGFYKLNENVKENEKGKVNEDEILKVIAAVDLMYDDIDTNVVNEFWAEYRK